MGSADQANITVAELNRTMRVSTKSLSAVTHPSEMVSPQCLDCASQVVHRFYSEFTGQPVEKMEQETDRDNFMSPKQALDLGLIDAILS